MKEHKALQEHLGDLMVISALPCGEPVSMRRYPSILQAKVFKAASKHT